MPNDTHRKIYARGEDGGVQLAAGDDRWILYEDHVLLAPVQRRLGEPLLRVDAELMPFVDAPRRGALVIVDMQNDFCEPGGWVEASGQDPQRCRAAIPGVQRAVDAARAHGMWVVWLYWSIRPDLRNLGAPTLYAYKHKPSQRGIGEPQGKGRVLVAGSWNAEIVDDLKPYVRDEDVRIEKVRFSGFWGTELDPVLRTQGISTLYFAGVNTDQCVGTTMQDAFFRDYNCVLLEDATATSSPDYCKQDVVYNAKHCWGFSTTVEKLAGARAVR